MEVEGRKGDTILKGADELYHDEAFRAKASPPVFNVNNFFEISICKPENFLTGADEPYNDEAFRAKTSPNFQLVFSPAGLTEIQVRWLQPDCRFFSEAINLSSKPENLLSVRLFFTAIPNAFRCPMRTTSFLPRVTPV